ncbi:hypothetical protein JTE90_023818 [Oedothorax gibbosus]|uniref:Uncharacterized protein n=1 Tax=Oedothorax gibbosus TaxID=931172 RepID=A0AAV6VK53_9ARAC|nr:hypothetical protein JTE90_023818 [Oedothorax gibbosus]
MSCGIVPWSSVLCELMTPDPCHSKAIDMQRCLKANRYREGACFGAMTVMEKCCTRWKGRSSCCMFYETKRPSTVSRKNPVNDLSTDHFMLFEIFLCH